MGRRICLLALAALGGCVAPRYAALPPRGDPPLSREEALRLVSAGVSESVLLDLVERRGVDPLDADALAALKTAGAGDALLQKMILSVRILPPPEPAPVLVDHSHHHYHWGSSVRFGFSSRRYCRPPARGIRIYR